MSRVYIHPTSVVFKTGNYDTQWLAFLDKIQTSKVFIKDVSTVSVFALLLLSCKPLLYASLPGKQNQDLAVRMDACLLEERKASA